jgi:hypothetical protein
MAVCCQNLPLDALSSRSAPSMLVGALFKKFGLFLNTDVHKNKLLSVLRRSSSEKILDLQTTGQDNNKFTA